MCISVVLSSDDEESGDVAQDRSPAVHSEAVTNHKEATDIHNMQVSRMCPCPIFDPHLFSTTQTCFIKCSLSKSDPGFNFIFNL